jgi:N-acylneuraminate cytidylyltransferase
MKIFGLVPARGGSKRIPNKNIKPFFSRPVISYPIRALLGVDSISKVVVSTDSERIKCIAEEFGASVPYMRSEKNSNDFATTFNVVSEVLDCEGEKYDVVCCLYPTSVFVTATMLNEAMRLLLTNKEATSIASVLEYSHPIQRSLSMKEGFLASNSPDSYNTRSQDLEPNYHDAGQFYIFKVDAVKAEKRLITKKCIPYILQSNSAQDIDTLDDWTLAELKFEYLKMNV